MTGIPSLLGHGRDEHVPDEDWLPFVMARMGRELRAIVPLHESRRCSRTGDPGSWYVSLHSYSTYLPFLLKTGRNLLHRGARK